MKLHILSDLHLSVHGMETPHTDADVVILAGDIARPKAAVAWAMGFDRPVIYIPGNHEFYGSSVNAVPQELKRLCAGTHIHVLDNDALQIQGIRFLGSTLWTDYRIAGDGQQRSRAMDEARAFAYDFSRVTIGEPPAHRILTPEDTTVLFEANTRWLDEALSRPFDGPTVVITHHAPSPQSIHPRFADSLLNGFFVSDAEWLLQGRRAQLWIHGHLHDSFDYQVDGTRVVCNPRGYAKDGVNENARFDPGFTMTLP